MSTQPAAPIPPDQFIIVYSLSITLRQVSAARAVSPSVTAPISVAENYAIPEAVELVLRGGAAPG